MCLFIPADNLSQASQWCSTRTGYRELHVCVCSLTCPPSLFCGCATLVWQTRGEFWVKLGFVYNLGVFCRSFAVFLSVYRENSVTCITGPVNALQRDLGVCYTVDSLLHSSVSYWISVHSFLLPTWPKHRSQCWCGHSRCQSCILVTDWLQSRAVRSCAGLCSVPALLCLQWPLPPFVFIYWACCRELSQQNPFQTSNPFFNKYTLQRQSSTLC